jgi:hypothetical protein
LTELATYKNNQKKTGIKVANTNKKRKREDMKGK